MADAERCTADQLALGGTRGRGLIDDDNLIRLPIALLDRRETTK
jgi:hypothetical protein